MDTILQTQSDDQVYPAGGNSEKSELMMLFERNVYDAYWAYRDLLSAIFESDEEATA